ncbi:MAG: hypothetical protein Q7U51_13265 [Methanoregula sp.]|nr:hypothetical protein [Methanoregula sp.]
MRINEKKVIKWEKIAILSGLGLSLLLILLSRLFEASYHPFVVIILAFLSATTMMCGAGLVLDDNSKRCGGFILSFLIPLLLYFTIVKPFFIFEAIIVGIIVGSIVSFKFFIEKRFDLLSDITRNLIRILSVLVIICLFYGFLVNFPDLSISGLIDYYNLKKASFISYIISILVVLAIFAGSLRYLKGTKASEVFMFGQRRSGKTYLLLALYHQFVKFYEGNPEQLIFCRKGDDEKKYLIAHFEGLVSKGENIPFNEEDMVAIYTLLGTQWGFKSIQFTIVDYAGEIIGDLKSKINEKLFEEKIYDISTQLNLEPTILNEKIGDIQFLASLKEKYSELLASNIEDVTKCFIFKRLRDSGKIILLVDGELIAKKTPDSIQKLNLLFGYYLDIIKYFGPDKKYALIVTKTDLIQNIAGIPEKSETAAQIEKDIFNELRAIVPFLAIESLAGYIPIYFFAVSVNSIHSESPDKTKVRSIFPWRVDELAKFGF